MEPQGSPLAGSGSSPSASGSHGQRGGLTPTQMAMFFHFISILMVVGALTAVYIVLPFLNLIFGLGNVMFVCVAMYGFSCVFFV